MLSPRRLLRGCGEVAERLKAPHSKCGIGASLSGVRIPPSPPYILDKLLKFLLFLQYNYLLP
jgi:hypothetical protein